MIGWRVRTGFCSAGTAVPALAAALLMVLLAGCGTTLRLSAFGLESNHEQHRVAFEEVVQHGTLVDRGRYDGGEVRVHYAAGEEAVAARALALALSCPKMLEERTGRSLRIDVDVYLYPAPSDPESFDCSFRGDESWPVICLVPPDGRLFELEYNRYWFLQVYPHELSHAILWGLPLLDNLGDNWLCEGVPQYLAAQFERLHDPDASEYETYPGSVALARVALTPWRANLDSRLRPFRNRDPERASYISYRIGERYAASRELVTRWMAAAKDAGVADPVKDLLRRVAERGSRIRFQDVERLAQEQTGRSLEQLRTTGRPQTEVLQAQGARLLRLIDYRAHIRGLVLLETFGLPPGLSPDGLFSVLDGLDALRASNRWDAIDVVWQLGRTVAARGRDSDMRRLEAWWAGLSRDAAGPGLPPAFWRRYAAIDRALALRELVAELGSAEKDAPLRVRIQANDALEHLTGADVGWRMELPPKERAARAARWKDVVAAAEAAPAAGAPAAAAGS